MTDEKPEDGAKSEGEARQWAMEISSAASTPGETPGLSPEIRRRLFKEATRDGDAYRARLARGGGEPRSY